MGFLTVTHKVRIEVRQPLGPPSEVGIALLTGRAGRPWMRVRKRARSGVNLNPDYTP
jgi:hypothetical protein